MSSNRRTSTKRQPTKRQPTKRKTKRRPTKRQPTKRRSTKRQPTKRRSTKRQPTKRRPTKRRSTKRQPTKRERRPYAGRGTVKSRSLFKPTSKGGIRLSARAFYNTGGRVGSTHCYDGKCKRLKINARGSPYWG